MNIVETKDLYFTYPDGDGRKIILNDVSVSFELGKFYTILGSSGSGKTTFLSLIAALDKPEKGEILYCGENIEKVGYERYRRNDIGIVFQSYNLIPYMNALENVMVAMSISDHHWEGNMKERALEILESVGIDGSKATRRINRLSGGEQQRVAIARALTSGSELILADEPTGNLDSENSRNIVGILQGLAHEENRCVIIVTHDPAVAEVADVVLKMKDGKLIH